MKKSLLILLIIMAPITMVSQKKKKVTFKSVVETNKAQAKTIDSLKSQLKFLNTTFENSFRKNQEEIKELKAINTKTQERFIYFNSKEDFYSSALKNQTALYILIVSILVGLGSYFSLGFIMEQIKKSEEKFEAQKKDVEIELKKFEVFEKGLYLTSGNLNSSLAKNLRKEGKIASSILFSLKAALQLTIYRSKKENQEEIEEEEENYVVVINNLNTVISLLKGKKIDKLDEYNSKYLNYINKFEVNHLTIIPNKLAEIRLELNRLKKD